MKVLATFLLVTSLLLVFSRSNHVFAGEGQPVKLVLDGSLNQIKKDSLRTVIDPLHQDTAFLHLVDTPYIIKNKVTLKINSATPWFLQSAFSATVRIRITSTRSSGISSIDTSLTINYLPDSAYLNESSFVFSGAYSATMQIIDVITDADWDVWKALLLENELQSFPVFDFSCTDNAIHAILIEDLPAGTKNDEILASWENIIPADEYDLEWTYIDSSALASLRYGPVETPDAALIFENNASRVTVTGTSYKVPLLYDNSGTLFVRVRPVQNLASGGRVEADWGSGYSAGLGKFRFNGHERTLNWQATTSFAEEGKRKSVVQYYDGSLRSRQTVTKDNSTQTTVIAESIYDYQGRPVIQVMPAPTLSNIIGYSHNFNINLNSNAYDKEDFDILEDTSFYCNAGAPPMKMDSGSARYYSPENPEKSIGINRFIPDADGYPFTEIQYTQDNTGRISRQSGVGETHKLGSGHETKYYYGSPDQEELDALFGTEVGDRFHYFKNMVRDANGQYSISYVDMHGRTIATALAGIPVTKMDNMGVDSNAVMVTRKLIDSGNNIIKGAVIESSKSLLVPVAGIHTFSYSLNAESLQIAGCDTTQFCYDCLYDLQITITDDCNNQKLPGGKAFDTLIRNISMLPPDITCNMQAPGFHVDFTKFLEEGNYEITKTLTVSKYAQDYYRDSVFVSRNTCKTQEIFIEEQRQLLRNQLECVPSCQKCIDSLGTWETFRPRFMKSAGIDVADTARYTGMALAAYNQAESDCKILCQTNTEADDIRRSMLSDVSPPSGQYANPDSTDDKYSIFYTFDDDEADDSGSDTAAYYRRPLYLDENGRPDSVYDESAGAMVIPNMLSPEAFSQKFKDSWAEALLPYHPEACKLALIESDIMKKSYAWDNKFASTDTYQQALDSGYLNPTQENYNPFNKYTISSAGRDPVIDIPALKDSLEIHLLRFRKNNMSNGAGISLWALSTVLTMCGEIGAPNSCFTRWGNNDSAFNASHMCSGDLDMAWRTFRQLYLDKKKELITQRVNTSCTDPFTGVPSATLMAANHQPNFGNSIEYLQNNGLEYLKDVSDPGLAKQKTSEGTTAFYEDNCKAYALQWWYQLKPCAYSSTDSANIITALINVCKEGSDENHVLGSSTVKPSSTYQFRSFEDVMKYYSSSTYNANCNAYLITAPKQYDQIKAFDNVDVWRKPDSCQCSVINTWYSKYQSSGQSDGSFSAYLARVANTQITNGALDSLRQLCNGQITCEYISSPISLPPVLQCGVKDVCVSCEAVGELYEKYKLEFPGSLPNSGSSFNVRLFENFMNVHLGFTKTSAEYLGFMNTCGIVKVSSSCDSLQSILRNYQTSAGGLEWKVRSSRFYDQYTGILPLNEVWKNGQLKLPDHYKDSVLYTVFSLSPMDGGKRFCFPNGVTLEYRLKNPGQYAYSAGDIVLGIGAFNSFFYRYDAYTRLMNAAMSGITLVEPGTGPDNVIVDTGYVYNDWKTFKIKVTPSTTTLYYENRLVTSFPTDAYMMSSISNLSEIGFSVFGWQASMDFLKIYDENNIPILEENFNDIDNPATINPKFVCPSDDCETSFANWFNDNKGTSYSFGQIDSIYYTTCGQHVNICNTNNNPDSSNLQQLLNNYQQEYIHPASGFVDLDMRTFAGNITPTEGPKGVFNVNDKLIGNTIDSTETEIRNSYAAVWNTDSSNQIIGHLSALENGKFRLTLNQGKTAPCNGIIGMRYYQIDNPYDTLDAVITNFGSYISFGDGQEVKVDSLISSSSTKMGIIYPSSGRTFFPTIYVAHAYTHAELRTVTIYHTDINGIIGFDNYFNSGHAYYLPHLKNLRGYAPEHCLALQFHSTQDSSLNTFNGFKNKDKIEGLQVVHFMSGDQNKIPFDNYNFGSFQRFHDIKMIKFEYGGSVLLSADSIFPQLASNFPKLVSLNPSRLRDLGTLDVSIPDLNACILPDLTTNGVDSILNHLASAVTRDSGLVSLTGGPASAASSDAIAKLDSLKWSIYIPGTTLNALNFSLVKKDTIFNLGEHYPVNSAFRDYFNQQKGSSYTLAEIASLYSSQNVPLDLCPDYCDTCYNNLSGPLLCGKSDPIFPSVRLAQIDNCSDSSFFAVSKGMEFYNIYLDSLRNHFDSSYLAKCLQAYKLESFTVTRPNSEYHYTLYYYDQAGNLVKTIPPAGVDISKFGWSTTWSDSVSQARRDHQLLTPNHVLPTQYRYNTLNQVVAQQTPDAGQSHFWYDRLGRLVISQNARQKAASGTEENRLYSYTQYDYLGRITEVGEIKNTTTDTMSDLLSRIPASLQSWIATSAAGKSQITSTVYDLPYTGFSLNVPVIQRNLRNRVSYTSFALGANADLYNQATFYSYDIHGNVDTMLQDYGNSSFGSSLNIMNANGNRFKKLVYRYDLISGKVNQVAYQPGQVDQFFHRYQYDAENRLTGVETSSDSVLWQTDARYEYYKHGPLARTVLGDQLVQGIDYAYTLQGWLKGVNSTALTPQQDMSSDGLPATANAYVARDATGFSLHYFDGDYQPIDTSVHPFPAVNGDHLLDAYRPLYNGNISSMAVSIGELGAPQLYNYEYDRLNRLTAMDTWKGFNANGNNWSGATLSTDYRERIAYDGNGNILTYVRNTAGTASPMDSLQYQYYAGTNRLSHIRDRADPSIEGVTDIEDQPSGNYSYDAIGNLTGDISENMGSGAITWNVYGKITTITRSAPTTGNTTRQICYSYDAAGNRISKKVSKFGSPEVAYTWYVRDASGNVMSVYTAKKDTSESASLPGFDLMLTEQHLYGSSRLGIQKRNQSVEVPLPVQSVYAHLVGQRYYELSNHLGNVLATISDRKKGVASTSNSSLIDHYDAHVVSAQDYYPFGMLMPGRSGHRAADGSWSNGSEHEIAAELDVSERASNVPTQYIASESISFTGEFTSGNGDEFIAYIDEGSAGSGSEYAGNGGRNNYFYGFNGKENDDEVKGEGNQQDYGMRIYDPRAGRFLSIDPISKSYPWLTPYQFASNSPIWGTDMDGLEFQEGRMFFDAFILPFFEFGNGGVLYAQGSVQKAEAMSGRADYQNPSVPKHVQEKLARNDIGKGISKQISGGTEMLVASAEVVNTYGPMATEGVLSVNAPKVAKVGKWILSPITESKPGLKLNIYGEGEVAGYTDIAVNPNFANGRPLSSTFADNSAKEIIMNNSPMFEKEFSEIQRLAKPGSSFSFSGPSEGNPFFTKLSEFMKDKAKVISEKTVVMEKGTSSEYIQKTIIYKLNGKQ